MELEEHKKKFDEIIKKYGLQEEETAKKMSHYITKSSSVSPKEFADKFGMTEEEAEIFLSFIKKGIDFKEQHIDKNKK